MNQENIGAFIREIRKENNMTQEKFAEKLGVSQKSVSRWENGKTMPDYSMLPGICEVLNINVAELLNAKRIEGDNIPKNFVTAMTHGMIALANDRRFIRKLIGAILSAVIMLGCMLGLYCYEFSVKVDSTSELEQAINNYHFNSEISADVLERQAIGNRLYVLYEQKDYPGACGLACLEKGILGNYRFVSCRDSNHRWINVGETKVGKTKYFVTYCVNELTGIDAYGICAVQYGDGQNLTADDADVIFTQEYTASPFLTFTEIEDGVALVSFKTKYYMSGVEIPSENLEEVLGERSVDGAHKSGIGTAELGLFYVLEGILFLMAVTFIRWFLKA